MQKVKLDKIEYNQDARKETQNLEHTLEEIYKWCRRHHTDLVHVTLSIPGLDPMKLCFRNRGTSFTSSTGSYKGTVNGLLDAVGDHVCTQHASSKDALDVYQSLLGI
jgi:hypothetical protein